MIEWKDAKNPPEIGRYLVYKNGQIRIARWDGYNWIESLEFDIFSHLTHWAELPKIPELNEQEIDPKLYKEFVDSMDRYLERLNKEENETS